MSKSVRKNLQLVDSIGTAINLIGLALGLVFMYMNKPGWAFAAIALSIGLYVLVKIVVAFRIYSLPEEEFGDGGPAGKDTADAGDGSGLRLTDYRAEITFKAANEE